MEKKELSDLMPEEILNLIEQSDEEFAQIEAIIDDFNQQVDDKLGIIYARFCLQRGLLMSYNYVRRKTFKDNKNYWEYWYKYGTPEQFFLMSRQVYLDPQSGAPRLKMVISGELKRDDD